jgi:predicted MFS family arabinose efflux permease
VQLSPSSAPLLLALNNTATYGGLACSGALGGLALYVVDRHYLGIAGAGLIAVALVLAEAAHARILRQEDASIIAERVLE